MRYERESRPRAEAASSTAADHSQPQYSPRDDVDPYDNPDPAPPPGWARPLRRCQYITSQLRRRRAASRRLPALACGCPDPWPCRCTDPPFSERALDGWRDAAQHILAETTDAAPLLPLEVLQALYRRGGRDRALAEHLHKLAGGEIG